jgi:hypothetical protein
MNRKSQIKANFPSCAIFAAEGTKVSESRNSEPIPTALAQILLLTWVSLPHVYLLHGRWRVFCIHLVLAHWNLVKGLLFCGYRKSHIRTTGGWCVWLRTDANVPTPFPQKNAHVTMGESFRHTFELVKLIDLQAPKWPGCLGSEVSSLALCFVLISNYKKWSMSHDSELLYAAQKEAIWFQFLIEVPSYTI